MLASCHSGMKAVENSSYATRVPSGEYAPKNARGNGNISGSPPSTLMVQSCMCDCCGAPFRFEPKTILLPSGFQPRTRSIAGGYVRRFGSPPLGGATEHSVFAAAGHG